MASAAKFLRSLQRGDVPDFEALAALHGECEAAARAQRREAAPLSGLNRARSETE